MTAVRATRFENLTAGRGRLLAALLVVALLLCHGALGAPHEASPGPAERGEHQAHAAAADADHGTDRHGDPAAYTDCAVALFVVLLGAALVLFSGKGPGRSLVAPRRASGGVPLPFALPPPRGPTLPLLQVFRL